MNTLTINNPEEARALDLTLSDYIRVVNTPKRFVILARGKLYTTNNLERCLLDVVAFEFRNIKAEEVTILDKAAFKP